MNMNRDIELTDVVVVNEGRTVRIIRENGGIDPVDYTVSTAPDYLKMWRKDPEHFKMDEVFLAKFEKAINDAKAER